MKTASATQATAAISWRRRVVLDDRGRDDLGADVARDRALEVARLLACFGRAVAMGCLFDAETRIPRAAGGESRRSDLYHDGQDQGPPLGTAVDELGQRLRDVLADQTLAGDVFPAELHH